MRVAVIVAALAGCSQGPAGDGEPDGGPDSGPDSAVACELGGGGVTVLIGRVDPGSRPGGLELAAAATVLETSPSLALQFDDSSVEHIHYDLPGADAQVFVPGERVWAELSAHGPFWVNQQIELYTVDANGGPDELRVAAWWGEFALTPVSGWTLDLEDGDCDATDTCGQAIGRNLRVTAPGGAQAVVAPETSVELEGHRVSNGRSWRYTSTPTCTDTPGTWSGVGVVRL